MAQTAPVKKTATKRSPSRRKQPDLAHIAEDLRPLATPIAELTPDPHNARRHGARNLETIAASLREFGQVKPIVVLQDGTIIAGNGTVDAAKSLGWTHVAATRFANAAQARAFALADNRTAELAEWDVELLEAQLAELKDLDIDVGAIGFDDAEIEAILRGPEPQDTSGASEGVNVIEDEAPAPPDDPITQRGDLWILGDHRLLCGDSALPEDVNRLLGGAKIHLVNTDPPYNVKVEPRSNNAILAGNSSFSNKHHQRFDLARRPGMKTTQKKMRAKDRPLENDFVTDEEFDRLLLVWFGNIARVLQKGRALYCWGGYANCANYPPALRACGLYFSQAIIWVKEHPVLTRKDFMGNHEWCFYCWKEGAAHKFYGPNNATDVWSVKKVNPQSMVHLTEKPVELAVRAIRYSSRPGEHVLDLFGGSGSTLMGCEQTDRKGFLMEIDPAYCDVIVQRWEKFTGQKATREQQSKAAA